MKPAPEFPGPKVSGTATPCGQAHASEPTCTGPKVTDDAGTVIGTIWSAPGLPTMKSCPPMSGPILRMVRVGLSSTAPV